MFPSLLPLLVRLVISYLPQNTTTEIREDFLCCAMFKCPPTILEIALDSMHAIRLTGGDIDIRFGDIAIYLALRPLVDITRCPSRLNSEGFCDYVCNRWKWSPLSHTN